MRKWRHKTCETEFESCETPSDLDIETIICKRPKKQDVLFSVVKKAHFAVQEAQDFKRKLISNDKLFK